MHILRFSKFSRREGIYHYVSILNIEDSVPLHAKTKIKKRDCLSVGEWPKFVSAHHSYFDESLAFIVHFVHCVPDLNAVKIRLSFLRISSSVEVPPFRV